MNTKPTLIVVVGPTGSGKTELAIKLAKHYGAEILSTDSRQIYQGMAIGTAQPTPEERAAVPHHLVDFLSPKEDYTCGKFERQALEVLDELFKRNNFAVAVGGSGLYVDALCEGMDEMPVRDEKIRQMLADRHHRYGLNNLLVELEQRDPEYYDTVDRCNPMRVLRALEVCLITGRPYSELRKGGKAERPFRIIKVGTDVPRVELYERINNRVKAMMAAGLEQEARALYHLRFLNSLQTVGYRELFDFFDGACTRSDAVDLIKRNTRRYAKRQMTWFRRDESIGWFAPSAVDDFIAFIDSKLETV